MAIDFSKYKKLNPLTGKEDEGVTSSSSSNTENVDVSGVKIASTTKNPILDKYRNIDPNTGVAKVTAVKVEEVEPQPLPDQSKKQELESAVKIAKTIDPKQPVPKSFKDKVNSVLSGAANVVDKTLGVIATPATLALKAGSKITEGLAKGMEMEAKGVVDTVVPAFKWAANKVADIRSANAQKQLDQYNKIAEDNIKRKASGKPIMIDPYAGNVGQTEKFNNVKDLQAGTGIAKAMNTEGGKAVIKFVGENTSNIPIKLYSGAKAKITGEDYNQILDGIITSAEDPNTGAVVKFLYNLQNAGVQTAIGALGTVGLGALTKNPKLAQSFGTAYWTAVSANGQLKEHGRIEDIGSVAIDVLGDRVLGKQLETLLGSKSGYLSGVLKSAGTEGGTEVLQSVSQYANDFTQAKTEAERKKIVEKLGNYLKDPKNGAAMEFLVGAAAGAGTTMLGKAVGGKPEMQQEDINVQAKNLQITNPTIKDTPPPTPPPGSGSYKEEVPSETPKVQEQVSETPIQENVPQEVITESVTPGQTETKTVTKITINPEDTADTAQQKVADITDAADKYTIEEMQKVLDDAKKVIGKKNVDIDFLEEKIAEKELMSLKDMLDEDSKVNLDGYLTEYADKLNNGEIDLKAIKEDVKAIKDDIAKIKSPNYEYTDYTKRTGVEKIKVGDEISFNTVYGPITGIVTRFDATRFANDQVMPDIVIKLPAGNKLKVDVATINPENFQINKVVKTKKPTNKLKKPKAGVNEDAMVDVLPGKQAETMSEFKDRIDQLNKLAQKYAIRRSANQSKTAYGVFQHPTKKLKYLPQGQIKLTQEETLNTPSQYMSTLAHELSHALEFRINGNTKNTFDLFKGNDVAKIQEELINVTKKLAGEDAYNQNPKYYNKPTELLARFLQSLFVDPIMVQRTAPTAVEAFEKLQIQYPEIREYLKVVQGKLDKGQRKLFILPDIRELHIKYLGRTVGDYLYNKYKGHQIMMNMSKDAIDNYINERFKNVKDDQALLFDVAESIKENKDGKITFGTKDYEFVKQGNTQEAIIAGYEFSRDQGGNRITKEDNGEVLYQMEKVRFTPEQGEKMYDQLSPEGKALMDDFTKSANEATEFINREAMKARMGIETNLEGWAKHFFEEKPQGTFRSPKLSLKEYRAGVRYKREGATGFKKDLREGLRRALLSENYEEQFNKFTNEYFSSVSRPVSYDAEGNPELEKGWIMIEGDPAKGIKAFDGKRDFMIVDGKRVPIKKKIYQIPKFAFEMHQTIQKQFEEVSGMKKFMDGFSNLWAIQALSQPGTTVSNAMSGAIQYGRKVVNDAFLDLMDLDPKFSRTTRDLLAPIKIFAKWKKIPEWYYGGQKSNLLGGDLEGRAAENMDKFGNKVLYLFGKVEDYFKKSITLSENPEDIAGKIKVTKDGVKGLSEDDIQKLGEINKAVDEFAFDYENVNPAIKKIRGPLKLLVPFAKFPYKYWKSIIDPYINMFDQNVPVKQRMAKVLSTSFMIALFSGLLGMKRDESETEETEYDIDPKLKPKGGLFLGEDEFGNEKFLKLRKYSFANVGSFFERLTKGDMEEAFNILQESNVQPGPAAQFIATVLGWRNEYTKYDATDVLIGKQLQSFIPFSSHASLFAQSMDQYQRKPTNFMQAMLGSMIPMPDQGMREQLAGDIKTMSVPLKEGQTKGRRTTEDVPVKSYGEDLILRYLTGFNVNRINPDYVKRSVVRKERNINTSTRDKIIKDAVKDYKIQKNVFSKTKLSNDIRIKLTKEGYENSAINEAIRLFNEKVRQ
jgi:hypothetical protein